MISDSRARLEAFEKMLFSVQLQNMLSLYKLFDLTE